MLRWPKGRHALACRGRSAIVAYGRSAIVIEDDVSLRIVLGIGNPERKYEATRHNAGFRVVDRLSRDQGIEIRRGRHGGLMGAGDIEGVRVLLVKPRTYVNLTGECARAVLDYHNAGPGEFLVVADDVNLELGQLRCRASGSHGGHNGLRSIIQHLGTEEFARLRVGVGRPVGGPGLVGHVLGAFSPEERPVIERAEARAAEAVVEWVVNGVEACMNRFNGPEEGIAGRE